MAFTITLIFPKCRRDFCGCKRKSFTDYKLLVLFLNGSTCLTTFLQISGIINKLSEVLAFVPIMDEIQHSIPFRFAKFW